MQPITWSKKEFEEGVARKLAALKGVRPPAGASFEVRLALANEKVAYADARANAVLRNEAMGGSSIGHEHGHPQSGAHMMMRVIDGQEGESDEDKPAPGYTAADDSYGAKQPSSAARKPTVQSSQESDGEHRPEGDAETEIAATRATQQRLLEANLRQSSAQWVVLDRATVLHKLLSHPKGLTLVQLAAYLLGAHASPRDTRRLSAMMKREETRETVTRAGRGQPILLTEEGREELQKLDVAATSKKSIEERQRRVRAQNERLKGSRGQGA